MRHAGKTIETDVVFMRVLREQGKRLAAHFSGAVEMRLEFVNGLMRRLDQQGHAPGPVRIFVFIFGMALFHLPQTVAQGVEQSLAPLAVVQQIVLEIRITLNRPNIAEHFKQHPRGTAGHAFIA